MQDKPHQPRPRPELRSSAEPGSEGETWALRSPLESFAPQNISEKITPRGIMLFDQLDFPIAPRDFTIPVAAFRLAAPLSGIAALQTLPVWRPT
jgi:hypothetical protein